LGFPEDMRFKWTNTNHQYSKFKTIWNTQARFFPRAEQILKDCVASFSKLSLVSSAIQFPHRPLLKPNQDFESEAARIAYIWRFNACLRRYDINQAAMILRAVAQGQKLSSANISVTSIFRYTDTKIFDFSEIDHSDMLRLCANEEDFSLGLNGYDMDTVQNILASGKIADFLGSLQKVREFGCSAYQLHDGSSMLRGILGVHTWPNLKVLSLDRFYTNAGYLVGVFTRHENLENIDLANLMLSEGTWFEIFDSLRKGKLDHAHLWNLGYASSADEVLNDHTLYHVHPAYVNEKVGNLCILACFSR